MFCTSAVLTFSSLKPLSGTAYEARSLHRRRQKVNYSTESVEKTRTGEACDPSYLQSVKSPTSTIWREEYAKLKDQILKNSVFCGGFFLVYLTATVSLKAGLASGLGSLGSYIYLLLLIRDVDQLSHLDQIPVQRAKKMKDGWMKNIVEVVAHYQQSLQPRLLPLVAIAVTAKILDGVLEDGLSLIDQGCILLGFLSYKIPLYLVLYDAMRPKEDDTAAQPPKKSSLELSEDVESHMDIYGRSKPDVDEKLKKLNR